MCWLYSVPDAILLDASAYWQSSTIGNEKFCGWCYSMCGYGCSGCGRCQGGFESKIVPKGYCSECKTFNAPSAAVCKKCGKPIDNSKSTRVTPGTR
jgi:hypothetical protein